MKRILKIILITLSAFLLLLFYLLSVSRFYPEDDNIILIGDEGRLYLKYGIIYVDGDDIYKEYRIVNSVFHVTGKRYKEMIFFDSPEEADVAGYKPSESFARNYECLKQGKYGFDCPLPPDYYDDWVELEPGTIYSYQPPYEDSPDMEYDIRTSTGRFSPEDYERMVLFDTIKEAEADGYRPSEYFAKQYECYKQGNEEFYCWYPQTTGPGGLENPYKEGYYDEDPVIFPPEHVQ